MIIVLKKTEEKWLYKMYGEEYLDYCKRVNRCIPWFKASKTLGGRNKRDLEARGETK
jgi:hypothetical protein